MKRSNWIACTAVSLVLAAAAEEGHFDLAGDLAADGVAAVPLTVDVYRACGAGEGRLGRELRVQDAQGVAQPYVLRRRCTFKARVETQSEPCRVRDLSENADGSITLTAAVREGFDVGRARVSGVEIGTSLKDFAQMVVISAADGTKIAEGRIFDYTRFASVRSTTVAVGGKLPREFTITLRRPVTEVESAAFERVVSTGAVNSVSIRRMAQEQSFRVDAVRVCYQTTSMVKEPLPPDRVPLAGGETGDDRYVYEAYSAPVEMAKAAPGAENWAFDVLVERRGRAGGQRTESRERLYAINLPNRISAKRNFLCWPDPEDGRIRFRIDRGDNPPVPLGNPPFVFLMEPYEVVFVAKRGESYRLTFDRGADAPRYSDGVLSYLRSETSVRTLTAVQVGEFNAPTAVEMPTWIQENWATAASLLVLVALVLFCIRSFGKVSLIAFVLLSVTGCATSQMKSTPFYSGSERVYTGRVEDRVNLWPFAYYREPALSVLWPIYSQTDDHLAVRPIYSQYRQGGKDSGYDEFNFIWPLCQFDTKHDEHRIFPLYWGDGHVDFFPLVWWRFNKSFTIFPLVWWKDDRYFNVFPLWWSDNSHKLFLPFYYQDENSIQVIPFYGSTRHIDSFSQWIGPYGRYRNEKRPELNYDWCFPFYYRDATSFETMLFGWDRNDRSSWAFPLYYKDHNDFVSLPWISSTNSSGNDEWIAPLLLSGGESGKDKSMFFSPVWYSDRDDKAKSSSWAVPPLLSWGWDDKDGSCDEYLLGLAGRGTDAEGRDRHWTFPFFYHDYRTFLSTFWCAWQDEKGTTDSWLVPPFLSWGSSGDEGWSQRYLLGLAGVEREKDGGYADWVVPLYYRNKDSFLSLLWCEIEGAYVIPPLLTIFDGNSLGNPLFGWDGSCSWAFPLWYKDDKTFASLPYISTTENLGSATNTTTVIPPLLSWFERTDSGRWKNRLLLGLFGWDSRPEKAVSKSWMFPLYYNEDNAFISLPFAHVKDDFTYVTPLFGITHKEHKKGAWLWPLFGWTNDDRMEKAEAMLDAPTLDSEVKLEKHESEWDGKKHRWHTIKGVDNYVSDSSWRLSGLSTSDRTISWSAADDGKTVTAKDKSDFGNFFAYKSENCREVEFDAKTREKLSDEENGESGIFCNLLWHSKHEASKGHEYDMKSILWRFWHYEKLNGDVTVDSFPFFTYDSKTNGFSKTSLLWRLFRNEYDPKTDKRAVDFLFVPVWR